MKKVCPKCGSKHLHKHGKKRRICVSCGKTCSIKSGRKKSMNMERYLLDRSTIRRIATKDKTSPIEVLRQIIFELKNIPSPLLYLKKIHSNVVIYF